MRDGVGGHDLGDVRVRRQALDGPPREQAVRAGHRGLVAAEVREPVHDLDDGATCGDLVVEHDGALSRDVADDAVDDHPVVGEALLRARGHGQVQEPRQQRRLLGVAQVGGDDDGVAEVARAVVVGDDAERRQVVDRHGEEAVHLRGVERHGDDAVDAGGAQEVGDESAPQRDPRGVLLVRAGVGVVGDDGGDLPRRRPARGVDHQQELHQVLLRGWHQRLDEVDVALAAVGQQLRLEAVVAEPRDPRARPLPPQLGAHLVGECRMRRPGEDDDALHGMPFPGSALSLVVIAAARVPLLRPGFRLRPSLAA